ncbi:MAG: pyruvate formate-lyase-activating protein [bacterium]|nr:pyruvate formate-lyase-activating protein [bacterium]
MKKFESGYINSIQTMGLVDGPGIRIVIFMQGCMLRCIFCHNPETWKLESDSLMTSKQVVDEIRKYRPYIELGGGVTFSGGEPLVQSKFLLECLKLCKKAGIHTCIDTSGTGYDKKYLNEILKYTDLVILDFKAIDDEQYKNITGKSIDMFNYFSEQLNRNNNKLWIRCVIIPGINDNKEYMLKLNKYLKKFNNIEKVELLPYRTLGVEKYKNLNIKYRLESTPDMEKEKLDKLQKLIEF